MEQRGRDEQVDAESRVELGRLAREGCDAHGVLEQPAGVAVVALGRRGQLAQARAHRRIVDEACDHGAQADVRDLPGEELEEAVELVRIAAHRGREA